MGKIERRLFLQGMTAGAAGGLTGLIQRALAADAKSPRQGIIRINGDVSVNGKPAQVGTPVMPGETVSTGAGSQAVFVINDNAFMQRANGRVDFGDNPVAGFMRVVTGALLSVFGKGGRQLATPTATIGIRGTGCYIETAERKSYFCLCFGAVDLRPLDGQPLSYATTHHERPVWIEKGATSPAPLIDHTDAEIIMLEALVGRGSPFPAGVKQY
jgi:hypothetical protein